MSVSKILSVKPYNTSFKARTTITAPESLLSKEDRAKLIEQGKKIGTDEDTIDINISEVKDSDRDPGVRFYNISEKYNITLGPDKFEEKSESSFVYSNADKLYEMNLPKHVIGRHLDKRIQFGLDKE